MLSDFFRVFPVKLSLIHRLYAYSAYIYSSVQPLYYSRMAAHAAATGAASLRLESVAAPSSRSAAAMAAQDGEFVAFKATMRLPIAPVFASKGDNLFPGHDGGTDGVREVLAGWVMRQVLNALRSIAHVATY